MLKRIYPNNGNIVEQLKSVDLNMFPPLFHYKIINTHIYINSKHRKILIAKNNFYIQKIDRE